jgi:hypothetical protein
MGKVIGLEKYPRVADPDHVQLEEGELGAVLEITLKDKNGNIKEKWAKQSESYVENFLLLLMCQMGCYSIMGGIDITDVNGDTKRIAASYKIFAAEALVNDASYSIVVGTGNTAATITDTALETKIAEGSGAGQLQHSLVRFGLPTSNATQSHFTITRDLSNASGGDITVNEIGLYQLCENIKGSLYNNAVSNYRNTIIVLTIRDVISGGITIGNGETLTINYRLIAQL